MKEYIIHWNAGFGDDYKVVEAESLEEAQKFAYEEWREEAENNADYSVIGEATEALKEEYAEHF